MNVSTKVKEICLPHTGIWNCLGLLIMTICYLVNRNGICSL